MVSIKGLLPTIHLSSHQVLDSFFEVWIESPFSWGGVATCWQSLKPPFWALGGSLCCSMGEDISIPSRISWHTPCHFVGDALDPNGQCAGLWVERSWFEHWTPGREVLVRTLDSGSWVLIRDQAVSVLCSWAKHCTHTVPLHIQEYKCVRDFNNM